MWYVYAVEYYFSNDNEGNPTICNNMGGHVENIMLSEISQTERAKHCMISLYVETKKVELIETE